MASEARWLEAAPGCASVSTLHTHTESKRALNKLPGEDASRHEESGRRFAPKLRREYIPAEIARFFRGKEDLIDEINDLGAVADSRSIPCVVSYAIVGDGYMSDAPSSLYELMMAATFAVSGVVEDSVGGFWRGSPATVITVRGTEIFKGRPEGEIPAYINATIGFVGDFAIGSARFCTKSGQWSQAPKPGDEVFLLRPGG